MTAIDKLKRHPRTVTTGQYTLLGVQGRITCFGAAFQQLDLADHTGSLRAYAWAGADPAADVAEPIPVEVTLRSRRLDTWVVADLHAIKRLAPAEVLNAAALQPLAHCPPDARPALTRLVTFLDRLEPEPLRDFLNRVLLDPEVWPTLTTCKGSQRHHHAQPGGLLVHSIEVLDITRDMIGTRLTALERALTEQPVGLMKNRLQIRLRGPYSRRLLADRTTIGRQTGTNLSSHRQIFAFGSINPTGCEVAALLHDLGKLRAVGATAVRPIHCQIVGHGAQTTRLLDRHLQWLRGCAPDLAAGLDYTLEFLARPATDQGYARFLGADVVRAADRLSAALGNGKRLYDLLAATQPGCRAKAFAGRTASTRERVVRPALAQRH